MSRSSKNDHDLAWRNVTPMIEFACWVMIALAPFLRWVNGPAVTQDQFVVQIALISVTVVLAIALRIHHWRAPVHRK